MKDKVVLINSHTINKADSFHAGAKAPQDIERIFKRNHWGVVSVKLKRSGLFNKLLNVAKILNALKKKYSDIVVVEYPRFNISLSFFEKRFLIKNKSIILIHDVYGLRNKNLKLLKKEVKLFNCASIIIVHSIEMGNFLIKNGLETRLEILPFFDYLVDCNEKNAPNKSFDVCYCGNLISTKSSFLYDEKLLSQGLTFQIIGPNYEGNSNHFLNYQGTFSADLLPYYISAKIGLVWDGSYYPELTNLATNYTRYNYPHKASCYLAAGIPIISWDKTHLAYLIKKYNLGYVIGNLDELKNINFSNYELIKENCENLKQKITKGYFTTETIKKCIKKLEHSRG